MDISLKRFTKIDTNIVKGIAILFMVFHHDYPNIPEYTISMINPSDYAMIIAEIGKVCVALLTFVSGYGMMESYKKLENKNMKNIILFIISHYIQLLSMYYVCYFTKIFINFTFSHTGIRTIYGTGMMGIIEFIIDLLGLGKIFNTTVFIGGWYLTAIIIFYCLFPILEFAVKKCGIFFVIISFLPWVYYLVVNDLSIDTDWWLFYVFAFTIGIYFSSKNILDYLKNNQNVKLLVIAVISMVLSIVARLYFALPADNFVAIAIVFLETQLSGKIKLFDSILEFFGKNSANIWLLHLSFIYLLPLDNFYNYITRYLFALFMSLAVSNLIEYCKLNCGYSELIKKIRQKLMNVCRA